MSSPVIKNSRRIVSSSGGSGGSGGGTVTSVNSGTDITVDNTDPANPIVNFTGTYQDPITVVANYSALPAVGTVTGKFYWCSASQGTKWLPGSLGGTYYSAGMYYSNGVSWEFLDVPYNATQAEVNTGTNTDKFVTPATLASATTVIPSTGTTGDIVSFSAANTPSRIADVAVGSYLRSGGVTTLPLWSTLKLPNSATANRLAYATATNTWGDNSLLTFDGTIFTANGLKSNASGAYIGATAASATVPLNITVGQNNKTSLNITNSTAGASASSRLEIFNDVGSVINFGLNSSTTTPYGMNAAGDGYIYSGRSFGIMSDVVGGVIRFAAGGNSQIAQINSSGLSIGSTAAATSSPIAVTGSSNNRISIEVQNTHSSGNSSFYFQNNRGSFATYGGLLTCGSAHALNFLGVTSADKTYLISDGASSTGLAIGTLTADPLNFGTNNTNRATISSAGLVTWSAAYHVLAAGTATASTAPLKFTSGTNLTTAEAGAMEYNGTNLFFTRAGTTRENIVCASAVNSVSPTAPDRTITVNIGGTTYYIAAKTTND